MRCGSRTQPRQFCARKWQPDFPSAARPGPSGARWPRRAGQRSSSTIVDPRTSSGPTDTCAVARPWRRARSRSCRQPHRTSRPCRWARPPGQVGDKNSPAERLGLVVRSQLRAQGREGRAARRAARHRGARHGATVKHWQPPRLWAVRLPGAGCCRRAPGSARSQRSWKADAVSLGPARLVRLGPARHRRVAGRAGHPAPRNQAGKPGPRRTRGKDWRPRLCIFHFSAQLELPSENVEILLDPLSQRNIEVAECHLWG